jgi:hypothetical protein
MHRHHEKSKPHVPPYLSVPQQQLRMGGTRFSAS